MKTVRHRMTSQGDGCTVHSDSPSMRDEVYTQRLFLIAHTVVSNVQFYAKGKTQRYRCSVFETSGGENDYCSVLLAGLRRT